MARPSLDVGAVLKRVPAAAWMCALIALLNAFAWSIIVPPFQGRDEDAHFAYVMQLVENGSLPSGAESLSYSTQETLVLVGLDYSQVRFTPYTPAISSVSQQRTLMENVHAHQSLAGTGQAGVATPEPPLYYALQTVPYVMGKGNILVQLQLMRLFSSLLGAITVLLIFGFLRELLPSVPWAATVGALCVALQPQFAFMSGSLNPDTMLITVSAAIFLCLARAFRRGLTRRLAIALGLLMVVGFATKLNFIGVGLGTFAALALLATREARSAGRRALLSPLIAAGIGIVPVILYALRNALSGKPTFGAVSGLAQAFFEAPFKELGYSWQLYLPRLPGMTHYFVGMTTIRDVWFDRSVGLYGWMDTMFPGWVNTLALLPASAIALLLGRELVVERKALRARLAEIGAYAAVCLGVLVMLGFSSYYNDVIKHESAFGEPRYLLPLIPLLGAAIVLAVRGAGRRWTPVAAAAIIMLFLGHDLFSQLQVIGRYYG